MQRYPVQLSDSSRVPRHSLFFFSGINTEEALVQLPVGTGAEAFFTFLDPKVLPVPAALAARLTLSSFNTLSDLFNFLFLLLGNHLFGSKGTTGHRSNQCDNRNNQAGGAELVMKLRKHLFLPVSWCFEHQS
jgi:hypothetical protein